VGFYFNLKFSFYGSCGLRQLHWLCVTKLSKNRSSQSICKFMELFILISFEVVIKVCLYWIFLEYLSMKKKYCLSAILFDCTCRTYNFSNMPPTFKWDIKNLRVDQRTYNFSNMPPTFKWDINNLRLDQSRGNQSCGCYEKKKRLLKSFIHSHQKKKKDVSICVGQTHVI